MLYLVIARGRTQRTSEPSLLKGNATDTGQSVFVSDVPTWTDICRRPDLYLAELSAAQRVLVAPLVTLLRLQLDAVIDPEDGDGGLGGELELLHLGERRLEDAVLPVVAHDALHQVQADVTQLGPLRLRLARVVVRWGDREAPVMVREAGPRAAEIWLKAHRHEPRHVDSSGGVGGRATTCR